MRIAILLILITITQTFAVDSYAQSKRLSLNFKNEKIIDILDKIEEQSEFYFMFDASKIDVNQRRSINCENRTITSILDQLFEDTKITYRISDRQIGLIDTKFADAEQVKTVYGKVTDSSGSPLPGVTVVVKETSNGTVTNADGEYSLSNVPNDAVLIFSFVGMKTKEMDVSVKTNVNVTMEEEALDIEEVVAIGYGTIKKSDLTGSVSSVNIDDVIGAPVQSIDQGLIGRASGVMVTQTSGAPGSVASIRIRGTSSLQGGNEPLYVIDGFPVYSGAGFGNTGGNAKISGLATLNPNDIESVEILKDASATAIYGARAANGVVLITTKSGKEGRDRITFNSYYGIQSLPKKIEVMNAFEYATLVNEAFTTDGYSPIYDETKMAELKANPKGTDWQDEIYRDAPIQNYYLSISGGDNKMRYAITGSYFDQEGIIINSRMKRYTSRLNFDRNIWDNFKVGTHSTITRIENNAVPTSTGSEQGIVSAALMFNPVQPVYANKELGEYTQVNTPGLTISNPVATARERVLETIHTRFLGDFYAELELFEGLSARVSLGTDISNIKENNFTPSILYESNGVAKASVSSGLSTNVLNENTLTYENVFNEIHSINALLGVTFQKNWYEGVSGSSQDFVNNVLEENSLESGAVYNAPNSDASEWGLVSYLGRMNYSLLNKYLFSVNARIDGSSRFGENNKYAFFPSTSFAWRASEESFVKDLDVFSNLKLRTSFGYTGNQEIGLYNSLQTLGNTTYTIGNSLVTGFMPNKIPNPDLKWEKTAQFDLGIDVGFINNRLRITADYYFKKTTDLIYSVNVPFVSGFSTSIQNIGSIQNKGYEFAVESVNINSGEFKWETSFNISFNRNKVLELGGEEYTQIGDGAWKTGSIHRLILGEPISVFYGYVSDGIYQNEQEVNQGPSGGPTNWPGGRRYKDLSGPDGVPDGVIDATYDRQIIGNPNPKFTGGMTNNFSYKGFELTAFLQWSYGNDIVNYNHSVLSIPSGGQNVSKELLNRWTPENPSGEYPRANTNRSFYFCDLFVEDGSYLKLKTVSLAYTFPKLKSKHIGNLKAYITAQNYFTWTKYSGYDPEVSFRGASNLEIGEDVDTYPQPKTLMLGLQIDIQ
ncbi:SusC/RagA family TonB-linked outer membrane protein [Maribellus comscasis]|uniref:SusC/RagA family TonB-linked outer membrane protein n=2 Tax=Maribellus comscasis TaxID=2681766 RepID=A0A6I6JYJ4_9BACT|nr:SusC/RagA family TonB-linked outer membrane protein [Maribellus comscasis]